MNQSNSNNAWAAVKVLLAAAILALSACSDPEQTSAAPAVIEDEVEVIESSDGEVVAVEEVVEEVSAGVAETEGLVDEVEATDEIVLNESAAAAGAAAAAGVTWKYSEGEHFRRMTTSQGTSSAPDKIEVAEVFWYGCPHCYDFDPILEEWKQNLPPDVAFVRIPVIWNPTNQVHARLLYTAEALEVEDEAHEAIFKAIHQRGNMLTDEDDMVGLFSQFGVEEEAFREAYQSFGVTSAVKRAENLTRRYGIRSVPVIVVNGKYATDAPEVKSFGDMISVTDELIERERTP